MDYRKTWYLTHTLLGCEPGHDINRRCLYRGDDKIYTFNYGMDVWPKWKDILLKRIVDDLNQLHKDET